MGLFEVLEQIHDELRGSGYGRRVDDLIGTALARALELEAADPHWRPMHSAPRDGTWVELAMVGGGTAWTDEAEVINRKRSNDPRKNVRRVPVAWRPAHSEWDEVENND